MDEPRIELPPWLPWATTACLAALVACLGELWNIEKARSSLLRDQGVLDAAALKGMENQLEAERIVNAREISGLRGGPAAPAGLHAAWLLPPGAGPGRLPAPAFGMVAWDPAGGRGLLRLRGLPRQDPGLDYQLWMEGPGPQGAADCGVFHGPDPEGREIAIRLPREAAPGCRFLLVEGARGGAPSLEDARARGSIILASDPVAGNISD